MKSKTMKKTSTTDWEKLAAMSDDEIDYSDIPPLDEKFFANARLRLPDQKITVTMEVDADILNWFKTHDVDWQKRILAALRLYVETHRVYEAAHA